MPIRRLSATGSVSGALMGRPSKVTSPSMRAPGIRSFIRLKQRSSVVLPQPEGPIKAVIRCRGRSMLMSFKASDDPYQTESPRVESTTGSAVGGGAVAAGAAGVSGSRGVVEGMVMSVVGVEGPGPYRRRVAATAPVYLDRLDRFRMTMATAFIDS